MSNETMDKSRQAQPHTYPPLDAAQMTNINAKLVTIAALRCPGELTTSQLANLTSAIEQQTRHLETLHRFPLGNADEPAFIRAPLETAR